MQTPWSVLVVIVIDIWVMSIWHQIINMMTSSNGNIFRVTGPLCGEFTGHWWISLTKASDVELWCFFFYLRLNKWLSKQSRCRWFETPSRSFWRHSNEEMDNDRIAVQLSSVISVYSSSRQWLIKSSMAFEAFTRYHMLTNGAVSINTVQTYITTYRAFT